MEEVAGDLPFVTAIGALKILGAEEGEDAPAGREGISYFADEAAVFAKGGLLEKDAVVFLMKRGGDPAGDLGVCAGVADEDDFFFPGTVGACWS